MRSRAACLLATAAVALTPATALAQGAGDDQYTDPFAGEAPAATATPEPAPAVTPEPAAEPAPTAPPDAPGVAEAEIVGEPEASAVPEPGATVAAQASAGQLPYTGADAGLVGAAGAVLLAGGVALRLRVRAGR